MQHVTPVILAFLMLFTAVGCASPQASDANMRDYVLVTLKRGPGAAGRSDDERASIQTAHLANISRLAAQATLVVAGPFGSENHDPTSRGIFIFDVASLDDARALTNTDPAVISGVLTMELESLRTDADLRGAAAAHRDRDESSRQAGTPRSMAADIRPYAMLRTTDPQRTETLLKTLLPADSVVVSGRIGTNAGLYILDARSPQTVRDWLGDHIPADLLITIDEWYASDLLVRARRSVGDPAGQQGGTGERWTPAAHTGHGAPPLPNRVPAGKSSENA
jgi:uncharacterized protein YciI